jgi:hypothetical protein
MGRTRTPWPAAFSAKQPARREAEKRLYRGNFGGKIPQNLSQTAQKQALSGLFGPIVTLWQQ